MPAGIQTQNQRRASEKKRRIKAEKAAALRADAEAAGISVGDLQAQRAREATAMVRSHRVVAIAAPSLREQRLFREGPYGFLGTWSGYD